MAYNSTKLEPLAGRGTTMTVWGYVTTDAPATVAGEGYFNLASDMLRVGDRIMVNQVDGAGALVAAGTTIVNANAGGVVDCTDATSLAVTDAG